MCADTDCCLLASATEHLSAMLREIYTISGFDISGTVNTVWTVECA